MAASRRTRSPVRRRLVACFTFAMAGSPYSRVMVDAWDSTPSTSTMPPEASVKSGVHDGSEAGRLPVPDGLVVMAQAVPQA